MSPQRNNAQLLEDATDAAREGDRAEARRLLEELLANDPTNVKALTLLYRVSDSILDKRRTLEQILEIDPGNLRAQEALDKLGGATVRGKAPIVDDEEVAPGISRRQLMLAIGGLVAVVVVVLGGAFAFITMNNIARENEFATRTAVVVHETEIAMLETGIALTETQAFIDATATFYAINSPTPTPTQTRIGPPTLPPEYTPTPTFTPDVPPTQLPAPPAGTGLLIVAGGADLINDGFYPILTIPASGGRPNTISGSERTRYPHAQALDRIVFTLYSRFTFEYSLASLSLTENSSEPELLPERWAATAQGLLLRADQANISADGRYIVFMANDDRNIDSLFILDLQSTSADPLTRLTNDDYHYAFPAFSADGQRVVAVRTDNSGNTDLFEINVNSKALHPITTDGGTMIETMPRYHPTENEIVYAARSPEAETHDIFIRPADGSGRALNITADYAGDDDIHPVYSHDGRYIAYSSNRAQGYNVYVYDRTDGGLYQLTSGRDDYFVGAWVN